MRIARFGLAMAVALLAAVGCKTVQPVMQPAQYIPQENPDLVVVIYKDNAQVPVSKPRMSGDTLMGTWAGLGEPVAVPMNQVRRIDAIQPNRKRTVIAVAAIAGVAALGVWGITQLTEGGGKVCDYSYQPHSAKGEGCIVDQ